MLRVQFFHDWVFVFRESVLELYFLPPSLVTNKARKIHPEAFYKWNFQINSLSVTERVSYVHDRAEKRCRVCDPQGFVTTTAVVGEETKDVKVVCTCRYRPLSIAVRFDSYYPWPVNLLHHYVLHVTPERFSAFNVHAPRVPFMLPPQLTHTIPSVVRLFGHSVLVLGRFGTLVWTDSEANNSEEVHGSTQEYFAEGIGERVAGRRLLLPLPATLESQMSPVQDAGAAGTEVMQGSAPGEGMQTSVFSTRLTEGWYSVALSESTGRIAIGDGEGNIELWDHF